MQKLIIIIPAFNEEERIADTIKAVLRIKLKLAKKNIGMSVYVIDDGSTDNTGKLARDTGVERVLTHQTNQGLGAAVRTGLIAAQADGADIVVKFDADLQHDSEDIIAIVQPIIDDSADIVYGNRFERIDYDMPLLRKTGNITFTAIMRWLTKWPLKDSQPGIFAVNNVYLERFYLPGDYNYTQQILLDAYHKGMRFRHVPVAFHERITGKSFISLKYPLKVLQQITMVLVGVKPMRVFAPIGLVALGIGSTVFIVELFYWFLGKTPKPVMHVNVTLGLLLFGLQTVFFGILAELIVRFQQKPQISINNKNSGTEKKRKG
jgi:glycosyltransferase involved in cell wall biosynthesis